MVATRIIKVGVAGLGAGVRPIVRAMNAAPFIELAAAADLRPAALEEFERKYGGKTYDSVEGLVNDPDVEVVFITTPNRCHAEHTVLAAEAGKHVVVEQPMAPSLAEAALMVEATEKHNVKLMCDHTAALMIGFRAMRRVITSGRIGPVQAINCWSYNDWMFRPRMPEELDAGLGGGPPFQQGPHQFDVVRLMGGGMVKSVRGSVRDWMPFRTTIQSGGYYTAFLEFEDGTPATVMKNGYGYFSTTELLPWAEVSPSAQDSAVLRKTLRAGKPAGEHDEKISDMLGEGESSTAPTNGGELGDSGGSGFQADAGLVIVSCEKGDVRQAPGGLFVYDDDGKHEEAVHGVGEWPANYDMAGVGEMCMSLLEDRPVAQHGRWGMATLEVVLAMLQSSREGREIKLCHQVPAWE
jgi:phthalate 4,5-cis-dihydrodiol dehydrogenase